MDDHPSKFKLRPLFGGQDRRHLTGLVGKTASLGEFQITFSTPDRVLHSFHSTMER